MKPTATTCKSVVSGVLIAASLAFTASTAMAAPAKTHKTATATHHVVRTRHVAAAWQQPGWQQPGLAQFFGGLFGLPFPVATYAAPQITAHAARSGGGGGGYDEGYTPPDTSAQDAVGWAAEQSAIDAANQASQEITQEANDMAASNAAAAAQNAADEDMINQDMMNQVNSQ